MKKKLLFIFIILCMLMAVGCSNEKNNQELETEANASNINGVVEKQTKPYEIKDKKDLYEKDPTSVVTMYLTVTQGNAKTNTNHTWSEVNEHSVYYYEENNLERFSVNGLLQVGDENGPLYGELGYGLITPNSTVSIRGQVSSKAHQKNYKIKLYDDCGDYDGQTIINLNKHCMDGMRYTNKLMYDMMVDLDEMISMKTQFVHLYVKDLTDKNNDVFTNYGLYTQVEQPNKSFLKRHGLDENGQLYKANFFEFYNYEDDIKLKSDEDYDEEKFAFHLDSKGDSDHSKLIEMLKDVNDYTITPEELLDTWFDEENIASWMAFHILTGNTDTQSRNFLLYSPKNLKKFYFISWDNDAAFNHMENEILETESNDGYEKGVSNYWGTVLFKRLLMSSSFRNTLNEKIEEYYDYFKSGALETKANALAKTIKPYVYGEVDKIYEPLVESDFDYLTKNIKKEIEINYEGYKYSLEAPLPFFIGEPERRNGGIYFNWDKSYDFDNEDIKYTVELSDDYSFENIIYREDNLFITELQYNEQLAPGEYYLRVKATNDSGYEQYAFDLYQDDTSKKYYGVMVFYVLSNGEVGVVVEE